MKRTAIAGGSFNRNRISRHRRQRILNQAVCEPLELRQLLTDPTLTTWIPAVGATEGTWGRYDFHLTLDDSVWENQVNVTGTVNWNDGSDPTPLGYEDSDGYAPGDIDNYSANHTYAEGGDHTITLDVWYNDVETVYDNLDFYVAQVAPYATLNFTDPAADGSVTASLDDAFSPSQQATEDGLRYAFSISGYSLGSYEEASTDNSHTFTGAEMDAMGDNQQIYARVWDSRENWRLYRVGFPAIAAAPAGSDRINLTWGYQGDDGVSGESGWRILYWKTGDSGNKQQIDIASNSTQYLMTGLDNGTSYSFQVRAFDDSGDHNETLYCPKRTATTFLSAPSNLKADAITDSGLTLTWTDNSQDESGFKVFRSVNGSAFNYSTPYATLPAHSGSDPVVYPVTGLDSSTNYTFQVVAFSSDVSLSDKSAPVSITTAINTKPLAIQGVTSAQIGDTVILRAAGGGTGVVTNVWTVTKDGIVVPFTDIDDAASGCSFQAKDAGTYVINLAQFVSGTATIAPTLNVQVSSTGVRYLQIKGPDVVEQTRGSGFRADINLSDPIFRGVAWDSGTVNFDYPTMHFAWTIQKDGDTSTTPITSTYFNTATYIPPSSAAVDGYTISCVISIVPAGMTSGQPVYKGSLHFKAVAPATDPFQYREFDPSVLPPGNYGDPSFELGEDVVELPDGRLLTVTRAELPSDSPFYGILEMLEPNIKDVDTTWGNSGHVELHLPPPPSGYGDYVHFDAGGDRSLNSQYKLALLPGGKILVAGSLDYINDGYTDVEGGPFAIHHWFVGRYNADGSLDTSFGVNGDGYFITTNQFAPKLVFFSDMVIQPDGKILLGGEGRTRGGHQIWSSASEFDPNMPDYYDSRRAFTLVRLKADGTVDTGFGSSGISQIEVADDQFKNQTDSGDNYAPDFSPEAISSLIIQPSDDGFKIVAGGWSELMDSDGIVPQETDFALVRLDEDGSLDSDFGTNGRVLGPAPGSHHRAAIVNLELTHDNKIVAIGNEDFGAAGDQPIANLYDWGGTQTLIARYDENGTLDSTFGSGDGFVEPGALSVRTTFNGYLDPQDRIVVTGDWSPNPNFGGEGFIARLNPDGTMDSSFSAPAGGSTGTIEVGAPGSLNANQSSDFVQWRVAKPSNRGDIILIGDRWAYDASEFPEFPYLFYQGSITARYTPFLPEIRNLSASLQDDSTVVLHWIDAGSSEVGFAIERSTDDGANWAQIGVVGANETSYTDLDTQVDAAYWYRVRPFSTDTSGTLQYNAYSNIVKVKTNTLEKTGQLLQETLVFNESNLKGASLTSHMILENGMTYRLKASGAFYVGGGSSDPARADADHIHFNGPPETWDKPKPGDNNHYAWVNADLGIKFAGSTDSPNWGDPAADGNYTVSIVGDGQPLSIYYLDTTYRDNSYYLPHTSTVAFPSFGPMKVEIYRLLPGKPGLLRASADRANKRINLSWRNVTPESTEISVERKIGSGSYSVIATLPGNASSYSDTSVTNLNTQYTYRVRARNGSSYSNYSDESSAALINRPPTIASIGTQYAYAESMFKLQIDAVDPEDGLTGLKYYVMNPESGMTPTDSSYNTTGVISGWTPTSADATANKTVSLKIRVEDQDGAYSEQIVPVIVAPSLSSIPTVTGITAEIQPDHKHVLLTATATDDGSPGNLTYTWLVVKKPQGAAMPKDYSKNGTNAAYQTLLELTKAGTYTFQVQVRDGGEWYKSGNSSDFTVTAQADSVAITPLYSSLISSGSRTYSAKVLDQFGDVLTGRTIDWQIPTGSGGSLSATSGTSVTYTAPSSSSTNPQHLRASDHDTSNINADAQIVIVSNNHLPQVIRQASAILVPGTTNQFDLAIQATDADEAEAGLTYLWTFTKSSGAPDPVLDPITNGTNQAKQMRVTVNTAYDYTFTGTITDSQGAHSQSSVLITTQHNFTSIDLTTTSSGTTPPSTTGMTVTVPYHAVALDQNGVALTMQPSFTWEVDGDTVSGNGSDFTYTVPQTSNRTHIVSVSAAVSSVSESSFSDLSIVDPSTPFEIFALVPTNHSSPGHEADPGLIDHDTDVKVLVDNHSSDSINWKLWLHSKTDDSRTLLASGNDSVPVPQVKATIRPTLLANGLYTLELATTVGGSEQVQTTREIEIRSQVKLGSLKLPVTDLQVPLPTGGSIAIARYYDSARADQQGDFGYGWNLLLNDASVTYTTPADSGTTNPAVRDGDFVYITLPDGGRRTFLFSPRQISAGDPNHFYPQFVSVDGTQSTLVVSGDVHQTTGRIPLTADLLTDTYTAPNSSGAQIGYNPSLAAFGGWYKLKLADGTVYDIDAASDRITQATDPNGNVTTYTTTSGNTTISSSGVHVKIIRSSGRVSQVLVVDGSGNALSGVGDVNYTYDTYGTYNSDGNLLAVNGQDGNYTTYQYAASSHYLTTVTNALGVHTLSAQYVPGTSELLNLVDAAGKNISVPSGAFSDATGNITRNIVDPAGGETANTYDDHGNIIREIKTLKDSGGNPTGYLVTVRTYDYFREDDNVALTRSSGLDVISNVKSMSEYQPFFVDPNGDPNSAAPTQLAHTITYGQSRDASLGMPVSNIVYDANSVAHTTTYSNYKLGKPQLIKNEIGTNTSTITYTYAKYDDAGNLLWTANALGEGTQYIYYTSGTSYTYTGDGSTTSLSGVPKGALLETFRIKATSITVTDGVLSATITKLASSAPDTVDRYYTDSAPQGSVGKLQSTVDASGAKTVYVYDSAGRAELIATLWDNPAHGTTSGNRDRWVVSHNVYDDAGRVTETKQAVYEDAYATGGASINDNQFAWHVTNGVITVDETVYTAERTLFKSHYDNTGKTDWTEDQYGGKTRYTYDIRGNLIRTLYPDSTETRGVYDAMNRVIWSTDRFASTTTYSSGSYSNDNTATANVTHTIYDVLGRAISTEKYKNVSINIGTDVVSGGVTILKTSSPLTVVAGQPLSTSSTKYDGAGRVAETISARGLRTGTIYYSNGQVRYRGILQGAISGNWWTGLTSNPTASSYFDSYTAYEYDKTDGTLPSGAITYDKTTDARGNVTRNFKDVLGRVIRTTFDDTTHTDTAYGVGIDPIPGDTVSGQTITGHQEVQYDQLGQATDYFYDPAGQLTDVYLPAVPDALNSNTSTRPHWHYTYDAHGKQLTQVDPKSHTTTFTYDELGEQRSRTLPGSQSESFTYDSFGRTSTHTDFKGQITRYVYDDDSSVTSSERLGLGRLVFKKYYASASAYSAGTVGQSVHYTYDSLGRRHTVIDDSGTTTYTYDSRGNVTQKDTPQGTINYVYNDLDDHTETYTANTDTVYAYDIQGRLHTVTVNKLSGSALGTPLVTTYGYDAAGNQTSVIQPNGVETDYTYDDLNRLTNLTAKKSGGNKLFQQDYTLLADGNRDYVIEKRYDGSGNGASNVFSNAKIDWSYDNDGRLTGETWDADTTPGNGSDIFGNQDAGDYTDTYAYDLASNRASKVHDETGTSNDESVTFSYNTDDQLTGEDSSINANDKSYTYDDNGSQTSVTVNGTTTAYYLWDLQNRMVGISLNNDGDATDSGETEYAYDNDGVRVSELTHGTTNQGTVFLNDSYNPTGYTKTLEKSTGTSLTSVTLNTTYILGSRAEGQKDSSGIVWFIRDGHGSNRALADSSGSVTAAYDYTAFGDALGFTAGSARTTELFGGDGAYDPASGWTYHLARWRNGARFTSMDTYAGDNQDPISLHKYLYANANPLTYRDPSGNSVGEGLDDVLADESFLGWEAEYTSNISNLGEGVINNAVKLIGDVEGYEAAITLAEEQAATGGSGFAVIGSWPAYINVARILNAAYFSISDALYAIAGAAANQAFIKTAIGLGLTFILSTPPEEAGEGQLMEIEMLLEAGYRWAQTGLGITLKPPGAG